MSIRWAIEGLTDQGRVRTRNEDAFEIDVDRGIVIVADGMGGHAGGDVASRLAVEAALRSLNVGLRRGGSVPDLGEAVRASFLRLADAVRNEPSYADMGTTLVVLHLAEDGTARYAHLGDSRLYRMREGRLEQLTRDHTVLERERAAGRSRGMDRNHPYAHILVRSLMAEVWMQPDVSAVDARPGDRFLAASDGLSGMLGDEEISAVLREAPGTSDSVKRLVERAIDAGGADNVTVVLADIGEADDG